ncbi:hypothetical protein SI65_09838 [Aspergillus cristatus]|uniref:Uncharacterized protein n=1 Tax=Aspergillus cristatus TaxID=573508 RepID=A0A1E3B1Q6_ASPCR|nr:hypothetical protein SI65_09838 [Aspergillus cristatus]
MANPTPYTADPTFIKEYNSMVPTDYEGRVTGVWDVIMQHYFPKSEGYVHRFQDYNAGGFVDRFTYQ